MKQFTVLETFTAEINGVRTDYCKDMTYRITNEAIDAMVHGDAAEKVVVHGVDQGPITKRMQVRGTFSVR